MMSGEGLGWMRRLCILILAALCICLVGGCGGSGKGDGVQLSADGQGNVTQKIKESRVGEEFTQEELEAFITAQTEAYQGGTVTMESCKVDDKNVDIVMKYPSWQDYADFNQVVCFQGTVAEAAGADFEVKQNYFNKSGKAAEWDTIRENQTAWKILILEEPVSVSLPGKILYATDNVKITGRKSARVETVLNEDTSPAAEDEAVDTASVSQEEDAVSAPAADTSAVNQYATVADRYAYIIYK